MRSPQSEPARDVELSFQQRARATGRLSPAARRRNGGGSCVPVILHLVPGLELGGLERVVVDLVRRTDRQVFSPMVCSLGSRGPLAEEITQSGADVLGLERPEGVTPALVLRLARLLRREHVALVHLHNTPALMYGAIAARLAGVPIVYTKHGQRRYYERFLHRCCDRVVAVSEDIARLLIDENRIPRQKVVVIHNGVDTTRFSPTEDKRHRRRILGLPADAMLLGNVARLAAEKNHEGLLQAFRIVAGQRPDIHLVIVGDGPLRDGLHSLTCSMNLHSRVHLLGARSDVSDLLGAFDLFVLSSLSEGLSITLLEAMACGLPVVATDVGGNREVVLHGETGLLVPANQA